MLSHEEMLAGIRACIWRILPTKPDLDRHTLAADIPGWDSYATVEIIFAIEDLFGFRMTSAEMETADGIHALLAIVGARMPLAGAA